MTAQHAVNQATAQHAVNYTTAQPAVDHMTAAEHMTAVETEAKQATAAYIQDSSDANEWRMTAAMERVAQAVEPR